MKFRHKKEPLDQMGREREIFLWLPKTLPSRSRIPVTRWLEKVKVRELYFRIGHHWVGQFWEDLR